MKESSKTNTQPIEPQDYEKRVKKVIDRFNLVMLDPTYGESSDQPNEYKSLQSKYDGQKLTESSRDFIMPGVLGDEIVKISIIYDEFNQPCEYKMGIGDGVDTDLEYIIDANSLDVMLIKTDYLVDENGKESAIVNQSILNRDDAESLDNLEAKVAWYAGTGESLTIGQLMKQKIHHKNK